MNPLPELFRIRLAELLDDDYDRFEASLSEPAPVSLRLNQRKRIGVFDSFDKVPWASGAFYLPERISFTRDPFFHAGSYYVQEASSMFLEHVFRNVIVADTPLKVLDLCAAPGGKSTHLLDVIPENSLLVSNEVVAGRNSILRHNLVKWGRSNTVVTQDDARTIGELKGFFDVIVVDAPCSGEGLFRKQPDAVNEWSAEAVSHCAVRQQRILSDILPALSDDGFLVYSTCTYEPSENDLQIEELVRSQRMMVISIPHEIPGIRRTEYGLQFFPHEVRGEGYYISVLKKVNHDGNTYPVKKIRPVAQVPASVKNSLAAPGEFSFYLKAENWFAFPANWYYTIVALLNSLHVKQAGLRMGKCIREELIPDHALAQSIDRNQDIPVCNLEQDAAFTYLKCEIPGGLNIDPGFHIVQYKGQGLGWMKGIGKRVNNYFPREYRILM